MSISALPIDMLKHLCSYLQVEDICRLSLTQKYLYQTLPKQLKEYADAAAIRHAIHFRKYRVTRSSRTLTLEEIRQDIPIKDASEFEKLKVMLYQKRMVLYLNSRNTLKYIPLREVDIYIPHRYRKLIELQISPKDLSIDLKIRKERKPFFIGNIYLVEESLKVEWDKSAPIPEAHQAVHCYKARLNVAARCALENVREGYKNVDLKDKLFVVILATSICVGYLFEKHVLSIDFFSLGAIFISSIFVIRGVDFLWASGREWRRFNKETEIDKRYA